MLRGADHSGLGEYAVTSIGSNLGACISAGARPKRRGADTRNEDAVAIAEGARARFVAVADAHFGCVASEIALDHVLAAVESWLLRDPPSEDMLAELFFDAGVAVRRETTRPGTAWPESRTTLALAMLSNDTVTWAALGDSYVFISSEDGCARVDRPRSAYLGQQFNLFEVAATISTGSLARSAADAIVVATDGLGDGLDDPDLDLPSIVRGAFDTPGEAAGAAERLVAGALERRAADAVTVAVALAS